MVPLRFEFCTDRVSAPRMSQNVLGYVNFLRFIAMSCRTRRKTNLFEACALLQVDRVENQTAYAEALMQCLNDALGTHVRLYAPGTDELTFDENWLAQLGLAIARGDESSVSFLLKSRVALENQRLLRFLVTQVSGNFDLV